MFVLRHGLGEWVSLSTRRDPCSKERDAWNTKSNNDTRMGDGGDESRHCKHQAAGPSIGGLQKPEMGRGRMLGVGKRVTWSIQTVFSCSRLNPCLQFSAISAAPIRAAAQSSNPKDVDAGVSIWKPAPSRNQRLARSWIEKIIRDAKKWWRAKTAVMTMMMMMMRRDIMLFWCPCPPALVLSRPPFGVCQLSHFPPLPGPWHLLQCQPKIC